MNPTQTSSNGTYFTFTGNVSWPVVKDHPEVWVLPKQPNVRAWMLSNPDIDIPFHEWPDMNIGDSITQNMWTTGYQQYASSTDTWEITTT
jgi:hypothetical protein